MNSNQSIHITIKQPPNPEPIRTLGIFDDPDNPALPMIFQHILDNLQFSPKSREFEDNVKDEVLKLLSTTKIVAVARNDKTTLVYFQDQR